VNKNPVLQTGSVNWAPTSFPVVSPIRPALTQAAEAERHGLGTVWISERWGTKDFGVLFGAISQVTSEIDIAAGVTHLNSRHPALLASMAMTAQALSGGRLVLGVGRLVAAMWRSVGLPVPPLLLAAIGPRGLELAGRHFEGVILHPFLTADAVAASARRVRAEAEAAGRSAMPFESAPPWLPPRVWLRPTRRPWSRAGR
jgi:alkanesulfonate monooxygenase SsuD/methylene tetrahydromethanopterin reductase-like flavin-dependent oxidoreductase (luciferase family)